jgi:hypothetical protein
MSRRIEVALHWAAAVSTMVLGLLVVFPDSWHRSSPIAAPWSYLFGAIFGITLVGFHLWMLVECVRGRWTPLRIVLTVLMLLVPIAPAVIYFLFTRSRTFNPVLLGGESLR